ncbi:MAG: hypothetical protein IT214_05860 [Chitinophagaceae bacterium]|nr:hypothetical protein [Chitinophagaceae bacterium]
MNGFTATTMRLKCTFHNILLFHCSSSKASAQEDLEMRTGRTGQFSIVQQVTTPAACERTAKVRDVT